MGVARLKVHSADGLQLPQPNIRVDVEYYDANEARKLSRFPDAASIANVAGKQIDVPISDFLTYFQFRLQRPGVLGLRNREELATRMDVTLGELRSLVDFSGKSVTVANGVSPLDIHVTERIGESIGLCVMDRIHQFHQADWQRIPTSHTRTMDYECASTGRYLVQVETKGSSAHNNSEKSSSVSHHKASIQGKKTALRLADPAGAKIARYGTITTISEQTNQNIRCWLLDPPPVDFEAGPARIKLLSRLYYIRDLILAVAPRSSLGAALSTRLADLGKISDPWELDGVPLYQANGEPFVWVPRRASNAPHPFFAQKSWVPDIRAGGFIEKSTTSKTIFFVGFVERLLDIVAKQDFHEIFCLLHKAECK